MHGVSSDTVTSQCHKVVRVPPIQNTIECYYQLHQVKTQEKQT